MQALHGSLLAISPKGSGSNEKSNTHLEPHHVALPMLTHPSTCIDDGGRRIGEGEACSTHIAPKANGEAQQHPRPALGCKKKSLYVKKKQRGVRLGTYACSC